MFEFRNLAIFINEEKIPSAMFEFRNSECMKLAMFILLKSCLSNYYAEGI